MKTKKIPMRMCVICHTSKPKKELVRIVRGVDGEISLDLTGRLNGRGAYICPSDDCMTKMCNSKRLGKIFETEVSDEVYSQLADRLATYLNENGGGTIG
ncbi:MAG: YlxR family protein [Ruminococcaceae bacterium]|nr:YlxR family protein [Oscillospiraceae bacterium]